MEDQSRLNNMNNLNTSVSSLSSVVPRSYQNPLM